MQSSDCPDRCRAGPVSTRPAPACSCCSAPSSSHPGTNASAGGIAGLVHLILGSSPVREAVEHGVDVLALGDRSGEGPVCLVGHVVVDIPWILTVGPLHLQCPRDVIVAEPGHPS